MAAALLVSVEQGAPGYRAGELPLDSITFEAASGTHSVLLSASCLARVETHARGFAAANGALPGAQARFGAAAVDLATRWQHEHDVFEAVPCGGADISCGCRRGGAS